MNDESCTAVVEKTIRNGKHGPYAVASADNLGLITFSLEPPVWEESDWPEGGNIVILSEIRKKRAGWRANRGRFLRPSDEQQPEKQENQQQYQKGAKR
jgi:hypothetical protein